MTISKKQKDLLEFLHFKVQVGLKVLLVRKKLQKLDESVSAPWEKKKLLKTFLCKEKYQKL